MAKIVRQYCPNCAANVAAEGKGVNHVLHLILTVLLCGWWAIVWIFVGMNQTYNCRACGARTYGSAAQLWILRLAVGAFALFAAVFIYSFSNMQTTAVPIVPPVLPPVVQAQPALPRPAIQNEPVKPAVVPEIANPVLAPVKPALAEPEVAVPAKDDTPVEPTPTAEDPKIAIAARKLALAKPFVEKGNKSAAKKRLKEIIDQFEGTPAAQEAAELLKKVE